LAKVKNSKILCVKLNRGMIFSKLKLKLLKFKVKN